jgi:hypothetical protein
MFSEDGIQENIYCNSNTEKYKKHINLESTNELTHFHDCKFSGMPTESDITEQIRLYGTCLIKNITQIDELIKRLTRLLGPLKKQSNGKLNTVIVPNENPSKLINSKTFQPLHQDNIYEREAPKYVLLYCISCAETGGESILINIDTLLNKQGIKPFLSLINKDSQTFLRTGVKSAVLTKTSDGFTSKISPFASKILFQDSASCKAFHKLIDVIHSDTQHMVFKKLLSGDALLMDNTRVLHGRCAFTGANRKLCRFWF